MKKASHFNPLNMVFFIVKIPYYFVLYFIKGIGATILGLFRFVTSFIKYFVWGYVTVSYGLYRLLTLPIRLICKLFHIQNNDKHREELLKTKAAKAEAVRKLKEQKLIEKQRKELAKQDKKELAFIKEEEARKQKEDKNKKDSDDEYINENVKIEKHNFNYYLNKFFEGIANLPKNIVKGVKKTYESSTIYKNAKNQKDINRQALLLNFEGEDAEKSAVKIVFEYVAKGPDGKTSTGYFEAFSKVEVHSFLLSEGYEVYSIKTNKWIQFLHGGSGKTSAVKVKSKDLIFFLTQLSTYIKAGIPLVDALKVLIKQYKQKNYQRLFRAIIYDLTMGDNFSDALDKQGEAFPRLLINMVKASELTGELPEALDDMANYYTESEETRKQMISALTYPSIVLVLAVAVMTFIMVYVIPKFVAIYETMDNAEIPGFTKAIIAFSTFLQTNYMWLIIGILVFAFVVGYLYKNVKVFRIGMQWLAMHLPGMKNIIIYNEVTMFTKTFASLLRHNVFITDSMEILNKITNNEIYKSMILDTITNLAKGEKISLAFKDHWAFPLPAYEMIVTGEKTGQLAEMMQKVSDYYQSLHKNEVAKLKAFIEPVLIVGLTGCVGVIVLAVVIPMFNMYQQIQGS